MKHRPGAGVGGECIPVDPWFLISKGNELGINTSILEEVEKINDGQPLRIVELTLQSLIDLGVSLNGGKVLILGVSYKQE